MKSNRKIINGTYWSFYENKNLTNLIRTYNIKFAKEPVTLTTMLDKVAYKYYGDESLWWVVAIFNNIVDPFQDFEDKAELLVPLNVREFIDKL
jgi:hypothetical protein